MHKRCKLPPSHCKLMIAVMKELQKIRQRTHVFAGKHGFITPRDLFRWGNRHGSSDTQGLKVLAEDGYMLLAERCARCDRV